MADPRHRDPLDGRPRRREILEEPAEPAEPEVLEPDSPDPIIRERVPREVPVLAPAEPLPPPRSPFVPVRAFALSQYRLIQAVKYAVTVVEVMIGLRFLLLVFGASIQAPFVALVYGLTAPFIAPFRDIFPVVGQGAFILEPASLVALAIYPLAAWGIVALIRFLASRRTIATWRW